MANSYKLEVVTPERVMLSEDVYQTTVPGVEGDLGVLAGHAPLMTEIRPGEIKAQLVDGRTVSHIVVSGGFLEVTPTRTTVLADQAERADELNLTRSEEDLEAARVLLSDALAASKNPASAETAIKYAETKVRVARSNPRQS